MTDAKDDGRAASDPFADPTASAEAMAREELARLKSLGERLRSIGAATAAMPDADARAAIQDANLAAFEAASATVAGAALTRMRRLTADLDAALRPDGRSGPNAAPGEQDAIAAGRETLEEAVRDIRGVREREFERLMGRLTDILETRRPQTPPSNREDWEPFEG